MQALYKQLLEVCQKLLVLLNLQKKELEKKSKSEQVYEYAKKCIGLNMGSPYGELACAKSLNRVFKEAIGHEVGGDISTYRMYASLQTDKRFIEVFEPQRGNIILSPTGHSNGKIPHGHVGICGENGVIMSHNSTTFKWSDHWNIETWNAHYREAGGYITKYYRIVA